MMGYYYDGLWGGFGFIFMVIFWVLIVWGIIALVRMFIYGPDHGGQHQRRYRHYRQMDAIDILRERFAKGEISKQDYEERRKVLEDEQDQGR